MLPGGEQSPPIGRSAAHRAGGVALNPFIDGLFDRDQIRQCLGENLAALGDTALQLLAARDPLPQRRGVQRRRPEVGGPVELIGGSGGSQWSSG